MIAQQPPALMQEKAAPSLGSRFLKKISSLFHRESAPAAPAVERVWAVVDDKAEIAQRDGVLWQCIGRKSDGPGFIYEYKLRDEYNDVTANPDAKKRGAAATQKMREAFPAVEDYGANVLYLDPQVPLKDLSPDAQSMRAYLKDLLALGYRAERREDGVYLYLPDREALLARWDKLREVRPQLPDLRILTSQGIADDLSFARAFFTHDALLSTSKEFVHDHLSHVIPTLALILVAEARDKPSAYRDERSRLAHLLGKAYRRIMITRSLLENNILEIPEDKLRWVRQDLPKIEATLGTLADVVSSMGTYEETAEIDKALVYSRNAFFRAWDNPNWKVYFERRFGAENIDTSDLQQVWGFLEEFEDAFDALPKPQGVR
ncbi:MAG TPA: hypothetical protein VIJ46_02105 [Rhabdochlamydiaceae bacterium]